MTKLTVTNRSSARAAKGALVAALTLSSALALSGCEQHPYPTPAPEDSAAQPPPPSQLMGAPDTPDGQPAMGPPTGPDGQQPPAYAGPPSGPALYPQGVPARAPCPPDASQQGPNPPTVIICSTPVPNPVEDEAYPHHRHHHFRTYDSPGYAYGSPGYEGGYAQAAQTEFAPHPHRHRHHWDHRLSRHPRVEHGPTSGYVFHNGHRYRIEGAAHSSLRHAGEAAHPTFVPPSAGPQTSPPIGHPHHPAIVKPVSPALKPNPHGKLRGDAVSPTGASRSNAATSNTATDTNTTGNTTAAAGTPAERYAALQTALATVIAREAVLKTPAHFEPGQAGDVTLTVPSDFAQTLRQEAARQNLSDQTASVNLSSTLAGDGYTVTPAEPQSQPLTLGEPTVFHWKVTAQPNAKGPLQASLNADVLSDGQSLALGPVAVSAPNRWTGRVVGVGLLVLIALILLAWAAQRKRPEPVGAAKPRVNHEVEV